jgi:hypothetical protein
MDTTTRTVNREDFDTILIVGNGFDIAHELKTSYKDFLDFIDEVGNAHFHQLEHNPTYKKDVSQYNVALFTALKKFAQSSLTKYQNINVEQYDGEKDETIKELIRRIELKDDEAARWNSALKLAEENLWVKYFQKKLTDKKMKGENWIDFESEIADIVRLLELKPMRRVQTISTYERFSSINVFLQELDAGKSVTTETKGEFIKNLEKDLISLMDMMEFYFLLVDELTSKKPLNVIQKIHPNYLLSFNYTHTLFNTYNINIQADHIDFIHGEVHKGNLVLGTEETLSEEHSSEDVSCIFFKKYFQRVHNRTGLNYKDWFSRNTNRKKVCIFGHSLDVTDRDVLNYVIMNERCKLVEIYYHNENQYRQGITNLIKIIGKETLIREVGNRKIQFIDQRS